MTRSSEWKLISTIAALSLALCAAAKPTERPAFVAQAEELVQHLDGSPLNVYGDGRRHIDWDSRPARARTVCSSFVTLLLEHTYGWTDDDIEKWFGKRDPDAADYHNVIVAENGFRRLRKITDLQPGDFIAIKYNDGSADTGHVTMLDGVPAPREATDPRIPDTRQYEVPVIDSSASGHGSTDTRHIDGSRFTGGIGRGVLRLYVNADGSLVGYTWSVWKDSVYYHRPGRALVAGRLVRGSSATP